jgi:hypothetical protein
MRPNVRRIRTMMRAIQKTSFMAMLFSSAIGSWERVKGA